MMGMITTAKYAEDVAHIVRTLRKKKGMSVTAICAMAGVSPATWYNIERYNLPPKRLDTRQRIARALGVEVSELFPEFDE